MLKTAALGRWENMFLYPIIKINNPSPTYVVELLGGASRMMHMTVFLKVKRNKHLCELMKCFQMLPRERMIM